jgi:hypothetical protein
MHILYDLCCTGFFYNKENENKDRKFSSRVKRTSDLSDEEDEADSHEADPNNIGVERRKHANCWVSTFNIILSHLYNCSIIASKNLMDIISSLFLIQVRTTRNFQPSGSAGYKEIPAVGIG